MTQNTASFNSRNVHEKISLPSGKENIHSSTRSKKLNVTSKLSNKSCWKSACSSLDGNLNVEVTDSSRAIAGSTIKGTGFQIFNDDVNNNVSITLKRCSKTKSMARVFPNDDNNITQFAARSTNAQRYV
ncbi:uncharacterized protein LOC113465089 [Ceratina calcarata]|nr:uncharacterized protein LOC113464904 isoform X2 [Ceratina calcarata]XP_026673339.1 uncharacterized protein LOC113464904 isoform X2 [Ceratina calcarata]XP_026674446.1 uncharacterized protein LOC113465089 [Ceratina calcarata]